MAGSAQAAADDFARVFGPLMTRDDVPIASKRAEMDGYMERIDRDEGTARDLAARFQQISNDIKRLAHPQTGIAGSFRQEVQNLSDKIPQLSSDIEALDNSLEIIHTTLKAAATLTVGGGAYAIPKGKEFTPWAKDVVSRAKNWATNNPWKAGAGAVIVVGGVLFMASTYISTRDNLQDKVRERVASQSAHNSFRDLRSESAQAERDLDNISKNITFFVKVWSKIRADVQAYSERLNLQHSSRSNLFFIERARQTHDQYVVLSQYLRLYQAGLLDGEVMIAGQAAG